MVFNVNRGTRTIHLKLAGKIVLFFNCLAAVCLLLSYLSPYVSPAKFWPLAFFSLAYIPLLIVNLLFVIYWLFRLRLLASISCACILLGYSFFARNVGYMRLLNNQKQPSAASIRVMSYNVHIFQNEQTNETTHAQILKVIKANQPDILNIQEYFVKVGQKFAIADSIKKALNTKYYYFKPYNACIFDSTGLAIFTRYPIIAHDTIPASAHGIQIEGFFIDVKRRSDILRIYCVHLQSTHFDDTDNRYLDQITTKGHPDFHESKLIGGKLKRAFIIRSEQVKVLKQLINQCPYPYILTGDFNDTPSSYAVNYIQNNSKNAFIEQGYSLGITYNGLFPGFQLDYIMVSPKFTVLNYKILAGKMSDHYPIISDVELNGK